MKKVYLSLGASALLASLTFVGCGSGSTSSSPSTGTLSLNPTLGNIDYSCGTNSGATNDNGEYKYNSGDVCKFTFGGLQLTANSGSKLTIDDILEDNANSSVSKEAIWAYVSAATGLTQSELSSLGKAKIPDTFKSATDDILDFSSFDKFTEKLLADTDVDDALKVKFEKNKGKISSAKTAQRVEVKFQEIATPTTEETKNTQQVSSTVSVNGVNQSISYNTIIRTGDTNNNEIFGQVKDYNDTAITFGIDGSPYICNGTNEGVGSGLDYTSFLNKDGKIYMVSQFECQIGAMYIAELNQEPNTGALTIKDDSLKFISQKDEFGGFVHCAGQRTPWESHLGSEEYETNARLVEQNADETGFTGDKYYDETAKYWGGDAKKLSPYYYGWTPEVKIEAGEPDYTKHYSMGRFSHELSYVMPDNKTIYMSDDGTNVGLFMFVADVAKDLSAGTLYAAKWNQTSEDGVGAGEADITWVSLGHANDGEVRKYLDADSNVTTNDALKFSDIFDSVDGAGGSCTEGYTSINTSAGHECLKVKEGMEVAASRLETRRYAAIKGATTEFRKEEGITFDKNSGKLYVSMSEVKKGMEDNGSNDLGGNNHIRVAKNSCGAVYALDISTSSVKDTSNSMISSKYVVKNMNAIIEGTPTTYDPTSVYANNTCNVNGISNPDNISFLENSDILTIGEDTSSHENNVVWAYNVKTKELTRTFTTPLEAESTSTFWYSDLKDGFGYMSIVTQHPGDTTTDNAETALGYIGAFKNLTELNKTESINSIERIGTYKTSKKAGSEIVAYDKDSKKMFTTNGADNALDISTISYNSETKETTVGTPISVTLAPYGAGVQSVTAMNGKVAVAVGSADKVTTKGKVLVFDTNGILLSQTQVGYLPDMVTFNEDGTKVIVANEGEPDASTGTYLDVKGTIGILMIANADASDNANGYAEVDFSNATLIAASDTTPVRLGGTPSNDKSLDIEPEYITVKGDYAYVTLQENNALAKVNISGATPTLELVKSFGAKDYSTQNTIDIEEEGYALLKNYKGLNGLYMPDSIASYTVEGKTYLVTANEGDGREYLDLNDNTIFADEKKISKLTLDGSISADYANENDLKVVIDMGATNGVYEKLYTFGARSFTIWDDNGELVWDSGDEFAKLTSKMMPTLFNQDDGSIDGRSGNKGVEPEALAVGKVGNKTYAFVGFERQNVIVVYDITVPTKSKFVKFINTQKDGDVSPEGMKFVEASNSPTGNALLFVAYEMSGSTSIYEIK